MTNNNNNTNTNINNNNNINIQDLVNDPQFINAIKSISGSNNIPLFHKRTRPITMDDELSIEPSNKRVRYTNPYLPSNPFFSNNDNNHLLQPDPKVVKLIYLKLNFFHLFFSIFATFAIYAIFCIHFDHLNLL